MRYLGRENESQSSVSSSGRLGNGNSASRDGGNDTCYAAMQIETVREGEDDSHCVQWKKEIWGYARGCKKESVVTQQQCDPSFDLSPTARLALINKVQVGEPL